jgi:hypothetical protein
MKKVLAAGALAFVGLAAAAGVASATEYAIDGSYATQRACNADGSSGTFRTHSGMIIPPNPANVYDCRQGNDGLWYLYITTPG